MDTSALTNIPPKRLAIIAIGGVGGGLLWRHFSSKKAGTVTTNGATGDPVDLSKLALEQNSSGNLGTAQTAALPNLNDATRDMGSGFFPLPVTKAVTRGSDGKDYWIDANGNILGPVIIGVTPPQTTAERAAGRTNYDLFPHATQADKIALDRMAGTTSAERSAFYQWLYSPQGTPKP